MSDTYSPVPSIPLALIDHLPDAIIIVDADGRITRTKSRDCMGRDSFALEKQASHQRELLRFDMSSQKPFR
jgi:hypothetical protein